MLRTAFNKYGNRVSKNKHTSMKTLVLFYKIEAREFQRLICPKYLQRESLLLPSSQRTLSKTKKNPKKPSQKFPELSERIKKSTEKRSLVISGLPAHE